MSACLPTTFTISRAGTSMINGTYSLDTKNKAIKYIQKSTHPLSNKPMIIEIIKTKIHQLDSNQTYFLIQARDLSSKSNKKSIHYYASKSPFTSSNQNWQIIAGLHPLPKISIPIVQFNKMVMSTSIQQKHTEKNDEKKQQFLELSHIKPTVRTFLTNTYLFEHKSVITHQGRDSKHGEFIILNDTIFHPQGGGQPTDKGCIQTMDGSVVFNVEFVGNHHNNHDLVCHFGSYSTKNSFTIGDSIKQNINQSDREAFARLHSGGHLIDIGMDIIGKELNINFDPIKGFHFPSGPYVEYGGNIPLDKRAEMKDLLQVTLDELINNNQSLKIVIKTMECEEYLDSVVKISDIKEREQHMNKMKINKDSVVRVMSIPGFPNGECMCGGTHIDGINRIKRITVTKFKKKNRNFRVSYKVE